jgi:hypothetical protein
MAGPAQMIVGWPWEGRIQRLLVRTVTGKGVPGFCGSGAEIFEKKYPDRTGAATAAVLGLCFLHNLAYR